MHDDPGGSVAIPSDEAQRSALARAGVAAMVEDGRIERIVVRLAGKFSVLSRDDAADAVFAAVVRCIEKAETVAITNPLGFIYRHAWYEMLERARRRRAASDLDEETIGAREAEVSDRLPTAAGILQAIVEDWPTSNVRRVTSIVVEAAAADLQLTDEEIAQQLVYSGFEISLSSIRVWRWRGIQRLRRELDERGITYHDLFDLDAADSSDSGRNDREESDDEDDDGF